jgi:drug/metabolite transporter (DMT)-like permease
MDVFFVGLALASALLHAGWNALLKAAGDRLVVLSCISLAFAASGAAMIAVYGVPDPASWRYIAFTTAFYSGYLLLLERMYRVADVSHAYPLFQGGAPLVVTVGAVLFGGERITPLAELGVVLASLGIMALAAARKPSAEHHPAALYGLALAASLVIGTMMVSNAIGSRLSGSPPAFIAWILFLQAPVAGVGIALRRRELWRAVCDEPVKIIAAGAAATLAYGLSIYASTYESMAAVAALRQTSVVMGSLFGTAILGERPWGPRMAAACVVAAGSVLVAIHGMR